MREFTLLIGQLFFIAFLQIVLELFFDLKKDSYHVKILNIACVMGSLYLLLQFAFNYLLSELSTFITFPF